MRGKSSSFRIMTKITLATLGAAAMLAPGAGLAQGDLLIAPTRLVLDGRRGGEVILSNTGNEPETYRVTLELRRMNENGDLEPVAESDANATEKAALAMIRYAPRRVTLPPSQPQSIRISVRPGADLPDGEYRVHMSFAALPKVHPVADAPASQTGISINLIPIYGIVMPIIVRKGELTVKAELANPHIVRGPKGDDFAVDMTRSGTESATTPAPACTYMTPSFTTEVLSTMQLSISPSAEKYPTQPAYGPRASSSSSSMISMARTLGAPDTVPAGNPAISASTASWSAASLPSTFDTMCITWL